MRVERYRRAVQRVARLEGHQRKSPLWRWMHLNYADLLPSLARGSPDWKAICAVVTEAGILDGRKQPLSPERVRKTWLAVRKYVGDHPHPEMPKPIERAPLSQVVRPVSDEPRETPKVSFKTAKLK